MINDILFEKWLIVDLLCLILIVTINYCLGMNNAQLFFSIIFYLLGVIHAEIRLIRKEMNNRGNS